MSNILRTPEERFENLPDFPFQPHYVEIQNIRMHYLDEGEGEGEVILCLHGEPSWSFLYRKMIPKLSTGFRVVVPDLVGFGRSDKLTNVEDYSYHFHLNMLLEFVQVLALEKITFVVQDWGGLLGLRLATLIPDKVAGLVIMNTFLPTGEEEVGEGFRNWLNFVKSNEDLPIGFVMQMSMADKKNINEAVIKAYEAPFPDKSYKAGARAFPFLVPITPNTEAGNEMKEARKILQTMKVPTLTMFSDKDPVTRNGQYLFHKLIDEQFVTNIDIKDAGHFLQEEKGEELAENILNWKK